MRHSPAQDAVMRVHTRLADAGIDKGPTVSARLLVPAQQIGCLMGKGGTIIAEMRKETGASIRIFFKEQIPKCAQPNDEVVQVQKSFELSILFVSFVLRSLYTGGKVSFVCAL